MAHSNNIIHKGSFVTIIRKICDRYSILRYTILTALLFSVVGCGSKKKTTEINKSVYKEDRDLSVFRQKDILSSILVNKLDTQITFEPINTAIPIKINDSTVIHNARVVITTKKTDSTVINRDSSTTKMIDKGEVYSSNETKNTDLDREGSSGGWVKIVWGFVFLAAILAIGKWRKWF